MVYDLVVSENKFYFFIENGFGKTTSPFWPKRGCKSPVFRVLWYISLLKGKMAMTSVERNKRFYELALQYYGTEDLASLSPSQLDKLTIWVTRVDPNTKGKIKGRKYSGNTYNKLKKIF